jgi:hypothetical protein
VDREIRMARPTRIDLPGTPFHVLNRCMEAVDLPPTTQCNV